MMCRCSEIPTCTCCFNKTLLKGEFSGRPVAPGAGRARRLCSHHRLLIHIDTLDVPIITQDFGANGTIIYK